MKIERLELRLLKLPLVHFFETSFGRVHDKEFIVVRVDGDGASGYGECVADADPYYSAETTETAWHLVAEYIAPRVLDVEFSHPREVFPALKAVRGNNMAKAAVEMAAWDLHARLSGEPLARTLGGTRDRIASGVSIGIQDSLDALAAKVERELAAGYKRIKIKIKPGWDISAVENWKATVNGQTATIYRAGPDFMYVPIQNDVRIPATVEFRFTRTPVEWTGDLISILAVIGLIAWLVEPMVRRRRVRVN